MLQVAGASLSVRRICIQWLNVAVGIRVTLGIAAFWQKFTMSYLGVTRVGGGRVIARWLPESNMGNADAN